MYIWWCVVWKCTNRLWCMIHIYIMIHNVKVHILVCSMIVYVYAITCSVWVCIYITTCSVGVHVYVMKYDVEVCECIMISIVGTMNYPWICVLVHFKSKFYILIRHLFYYDIFVIKYFMINIWHVVWECTYILWYECINPWMYYDSYLCTYIFLVTSIQNFISLLGICYVTMLDLLKKLWDDMFTIKYSMYIIFNGYICNMMHTHINKIIVAYTYYVITHYRPYFVGMKTSTLPN